jgi:hypothetical protein
MKDRRQKSLNLLLAGGAVFGIIDHAWNGELFLIGPDIVSDLLLGVAITAAIVGVWSVLNYFDKPVHEPGSAPTE